MCILFLHFCENLSPKGYRLIVAFNRDEFYSRPTAPAKFLDGGPSIIAGSVADVQFCNVEKGTAGRCGYHKGVQYSSIFWDGESECHPSR